MKGENADKKDHGRLLTLIIILCCALIYALARLLPAQQDNAKAAPENTPAAFTAEAFIAAADPEYGAEKTGTNSYRLKRGDGGKDALLSVDIGEKGVYGFMLSVELPQKPSLAENADLLERAAYELVAEDYSNAIEWLDDTFISLAEALDVKASLSSGDKQLCISLIHESIEDGQLRSKSVSAYTLRTMPDGKTLHISLAESGE